MGPSGMDPAVRPEWSWVAPHQGASKSLSDRSAWNNWVQSNVILLTGAAGSLGCVLSKALAHAQPKRLVLLDHDERRLVQLERSLSGLQNIHCVLGDVGDVALLTSIGITHHPEVVIHTAALKHVAFLERHPIEAFRTNFLATARLLDHASAWGAKDFIHTSTDKAVRPRSVLGLTKALAEGLIRSAHYRIRASSLRLVNVAGTAGSVLPTWKGAALRGHELLLTDGQSTRWFMLEDELPEIVLECSQRELSGEILIPKACTQWSMSDLLERFRTEIESELGPRDASPLSVKHVGLLPGEKLHEALYDERDEVLSPLPSQLIDRVELRTTAETPAVHESLFKFEEAIANRRLNLAFQLALEFVPSYMPSTMVDSLREGAR